MSCVRWFASTSSFKEVEAALADGLPTRRKAAGTEAHGSRPRQGGARRSGARRTRSRRRSSSSAEREVNREKVWRSSRSDRALPRPSSRTRRDTRAPASPRICGGCSPEATCARKRFRAVHRLSDR
jgi:hypothetical protein